MRSSPSVESRHSNPKAPICKKIGVFGLGRKRAKNAEKLRTAMSERGASLLAMTTHSALRVDALRYATQKAPRIAPRY